MNKTNIEQHLRRGCFALAIVGALFTLPNAEAAGRNVVTLHHPALSLGEREVDQVAAAVRKTYRNAARLR